MSRQRMVSKKKIVLLAGTIALVGGMAFAMTGTGNAGQGRVNLSSSRTCDALARALASNQQFIANERANPNPNSRARIANRQEVIGLIRVQQQAEGCRGSGGRQAAPPGGRQRGGAAAGQVVCKGSTVTLSGERGAPAASSSQFPAGTRLRVTNLDNNRSTTVQVNSVSGSCVLLNNAAFEQVREPGKFLIRNARIERVG
ncbi:hypothetical protein [Streptomyces sp. NPDC019890]|uniref:hypothetical protein n=1 Tax=Streptomyces sp. NPDC019890 TaxID=3365064 RepID=UPI00384FFE4F